MAGRLSAPVRADLHLHTWCSDGALAPADLLALVRAARLRWWAVTDHDTMSGWHACAAIDPGGLVPGVEMTGEVDRREIHVVALGVDPGDPGLEACLERIRDCRRERLAAIIAGLPAGVARGVAVADLGDRRHAEAGASLSRTHLARALVERGGVPGMREAFAAWLSDDCLAGRDLPGFPPVAQLVEVIHGAGGVAILAHPGVYRQAATALAIMAHGLDGLEVEHPGLDGGLAQELRTAAADRGWYESAGSDFHAPGGARRPGCCGIGAERIGPLLDRLGVQPATGTGWG